jgi:hypothetical protein
MADALGVTSVFRQYIGSFMKTSRFLLVGVFTVALIVALNLHSTAQPTSLTQDQQPIDKLDRLVIPLLKRGDTNTVTQISDFVSAMERQRNATDASFDVRILTALRSGKTNEAVELMETRLDSAVMSFDYDRDSKYDKLLERAKEYRSRYPRKSRFPEIDTAIARVFGSLPKSHQ